MKCIPAYRVRIEATIAGRLARRYRDEFRKGDSGACRIAMAYRMTFQALLRVVKSAEETVSL